MPSPPSVSSAMQGALTPATARLVLKAAEGAPLAGATPRQLDAQALRSPWANLTVDTDASASAAAPMRSGAAPVTTASASAASSSSGVSSSASSGALPERYTADLQHWQSPADLPERRLMVQRIIAMTRSRRLAPLGVEGCAVPADRTPSLAKRIELSLYSRAASFNEYRDLNTLRRRLQSLVSLSFHEAAGARRASAGRQDARQDQDEVLRSALGKRRPELTPFGVSRLQLRKRPRLEVERGCTSERDSEGRRLFLATSEDVLRAIFAFLPGAETARLSAVNRFAARVVPRCVTALELDVHALAGASMALLGRFPHLEALTLTNERCQAVAQPTPSASPPASSTPTPTPPPAEDGMSLHAWGCRELDLSHDNAGEQVVAQLAEALERGAGRRLRALRLVSVFSNTCRVNALHMVCAALVKGACPDLEDLLLGGNALADVGAVDVAWLLRAGSLPKLARLDLRRNYVGESGLRRVMAALASGQCARLQYLCMGGNIITDDCVAPVVELLAHAKCPRLRFLGLEDNFLSARGVHEVIDAAVAGGMMPKLHHVACER